MKCSIAYCVLILSFLFHAPLFAQDTVIYTHPGEDIQIGSKVQILEDKNSNLTIDQVLQSKDFKSMGQEVPNLQISSSSFWVKFYVNNVTNERQALELEYPTIDSVTFITIPPIGDRSVVQT